MYVYHRQVLDGLMTRAVACSTYPPGSFGWNQWGCGAQAPAPSPVSAPTPSPAPAPTPSPAPAPAAPRTPADNAAALQLQREYDARIAAEISADAQARLALQAQTELDAAKLALSANQIAPGETGSAGFSTFAPGSTDVEFDASTLNVESPKSSLAVLAFAALIGVAVLSRNKNKR